MNSLTLNAKAILMMVGAIFCLSAMDATAKELNKHVGIIPIVWARYAGQGLVVLAFVAPRLRSVVKTNFPALQVTRAVLLMVGTTCFFIGLAHIGLAEATAVMNINPVLITLGAAMFLGEHLGPRRIFGVTAALIGALIVIRPGFGALSIWALFPLTAACCYTGFSLITRYVGRSEDPWTSLFYTAIIGAVAFSCAVPFFWETPNPTAIGLMLLLALFGTLSQLLLIRALTIGEAAMLAPFAYAGLIFATFWGITIFSEFPDKWTIIGALVITVSGIYVWHRETRT
ncbi:MAG: DMT family transporter [Thalassovita sp.]